MIRYRVNGCKYEMHAIVTRNFEFGLKNRTDEVYLSNQILQTRAQSMHTIKRTIPLAKVVYNTSKDQMDYSHSLVVIVASTSCYESYIMTNMFF